MVCLDQVVSLLALGEVSPPQELRPFLRQGIGSEVCLYPVLSVAYGWSCVLWVLCVLGASGRPRMAHEDTLRLKDNLLDLLNIRITELSEEMGSRGLPVGSQQLHDHTILCMLWTCFRGRDHISTEIVDAAESLYRQLQKRESLIGSCSCPHISTSQWDAKQLILELAQSLTLYLQEL
ncbi:hypothetical protein AAFF_G00265220 [Aldrovandia affinis]|uniref:Uncharacterized protein n=1 Tax=Aldrovandia affinis TaxID=143900 RepID=A0AAD7RC33_9TELE|nr:hypothetical protein AAFF_G00265220 [Aldrovandia affinis]